MFKKFFLVISFVAIFFYQAPLLNNKVFAVTDEVYYARNNPQSIAAIDETNSVGTTSQSIFDKIWQTILNFFYKPLKPATTDASKKSLISSYIIDDLTNYTLKSMDWSQRSFTQTFREELIGIWFNEVINRPGLFSGKPAYSNEIISKAKEDCPEIKITDIIYYFATKTNKKILFNRDRSPIDYPDLSQYAIDLGPDSCYQNAYAAIQAVPQGIFEDKGDARLSSTQFNDQMRYLTPQKTHGKPAPSNNDTADKTQRLVEDSDKQHKIARFSFIPQKIKDQIDCTGETKDGTTNSDDNETAIVNEIVTTFKKVTKPQIWIGKVKKDPNAPAARTDENGDNASNCTIDGHGRGMSQYGAEGMAISGKTYKEILTSYYGVGFIYGLGIEFGAVNSDKDIITINLVDNTQKDCQALPNIYTSKRFKLTSKTLKLTVEDYLLGLGEISLDWHLATHEAQTVAARSFAYTRSNNLTTAITDTSDDQVFSCSKLLENLNAIDNGNNNNQTKAVAATTGVVLTKNGAVFETEYSACQGQASLTEPFFNGVEFEKIASAPIKAQNGICDTIVTIDNE